MERNKFDLEELRVFSALATGGGFRTVADDIGLSASALSRQIARLEERLGTRPSGHDLAKRVRISFVG